MFLKLIKFMIKIGPSGVGGRKEISENVKEFVKNGLLCAEVAFTHSIYMNNEDAKEVGKDIKNSKIELSIHAPYYINLNSDDLKIVEKSKQRIIDCCERAHYLGAKRVVFHAGYYGKREKEETYRNIVLAIKDIKNCIKEKKWDVILCPETMGKINVFGSLDDIMNLANDLKIGFCIDFAHLKARNKGRLELKEIMSKIKKFKHIHCHYSGIEYGSKGEKHHIPIDVKEWKKIVSELKKAKLNCTIICEAPDPIGDALKMVNEL